MSWTVACFCGTIFESPVTHCPTCHTPVPEVTSGKDAPEPVHLPDRVADLQPSIEQATSATTRRH
jgi:hypothetical protein